MSVSVSGVLAMLKEKSYQAEMLKGSPVRGFFPSPYPYMDFFPRTHTLLHPLKSLGRLVSDARASLPLGFHGGAAPFLGHSASGLPCTSQMFPGHVLHPRPEELAAVVTEHAAGPLSSDFSNPSSVPSPSAKSSNNTPPKESLFRPSTVDLSPEKRVTSFNFSEEDLFIVLYGYSGGQESSGGHAISGLTLQENLGEALLNFRYNFYLMHNFNGQRQFKYTCPFEGKQKSYFYLYIKNNKPIVNLMNLSVIYLINN